MKHIVLSSLQLGQLLKSARKRMHLNQHQLGLRVGLSQARISHLEREPQTISVEQLLELMSALQLELVMQDRFTAELSVVPKQEIAGVPDQPHRDVEW